MSISLGQKVPQIKLPSSFGMDRSLDEHLGKYVILYFYPRDNTPGCTQEACDFRDYSKDWEKLNALVVGVSKDKLESHEKFIKNYGLPFELLSDTELELAKAFGVWKEKSMYGKTFLGMERASFLIDPTGNLIKEWRNVKVKNHITEIKDFLENNLKAKTN